VIGHTAEGAYDYEGGAEAEYSGGAQRRDHVNEHAVLNRNTGGAQQRKYSVLDGHEAVASVSRRIAWTCTGSETAGAAKAGDRIATRSPAEAFGTLMNRCDIIS